MSLVTPKTSPRLGTVNYVITRARSRERDFKDLLDRIPALRGKVTPELVRAMKKDEPAILAHLRRDPRARSRYLVDPLDGLATMRGLEPATVAALHSAAGAVHGLPGGMVPPRHIGIEIDETLEPRPPIVVEPILPPLFPIGTLGGFDACVAIGAEALGGVLEALLEPQLNAALGAVVVTGLPGAVSATLDLRPVDVSPDAVIDVQAQRAEVALTTAGRLHAVLDLRQSLGIPELPGELAAVQVTLPDLHVTAALTLSMTLAVTIVDTTFVIDQTSVVATLAQAPSAGEIQALLADFLQQTLGGGTLLDQALAALGPVASALAAALGDAVPPAVRQAIASVFPQSTGLSLDPPSAETCDIGTRDLRAKFLPAQPGGEPCVAILTTQLPDSQGFTAGLASPLAPGAGAGVFLDNFFTLSTVACAIQHSDSDLLAGLPDPDVAPVRSDPNPSVQWNDLHLRNEIEDDDGVTREVELNKVTLRIDATNPDSKAFVIGVNFVLFGFGWRAHVHLSIPLTLEFDQISGEVRPAMGEPITNVTVQLEWWAVLAAVLILPIALLAGGLVVGALLTAITVGAIVGAGLAALPTIVALILMGVIARMVKSAIAGELEGAEEDFAGATKQLLPPELAFVLGQVVPGGVRFDDLEITGSLKLPRRVR